MDKKYIIVGFLLAITLFILGLEAYSLIDYYYDNELREEIKLNHLEQERNNWKELAINLSNEKIDLKRKFETLEKENDYLLKKS